MFVSPRAASSSWGAMILPQLEAGTHGVEVVGMFFFDDNVFALRRGDPIGERLARVAEQHGHAPDDVRHVRARTRAGGG